MSVAAPASNLLTFLLAAQNRDGGWGYQGGSSWCEPTVYALMALAVEDPAAGPVQRGTAWLCGMQRDDGGWPPHPSVRESTWVTALALLAVPEVLEPKARRRAVDWLLRQTGEESTALERLRRRLLGQSLEVGEGTRGWPWLPHTAGWVMPTALTVVALDRVAPLEPAGKLAERVRSGREFLLARTCRDGGWNHGSSRALGYEAASYPETSGVALVALHGLDVPQVRRALVKAEEFLPRCRAAFSLSWVRLGLVAHGRRPAPWNESQVRCHGVLDAAMLLLARAAENGRPFWRQA